MTKLLASGIPPEITRELGARLTNVTVREFDNAQQLARAASQDDVAFLLISDLLPTAEAINAARRGKDANDALRIGFCVTKPRGETSLRELDEIAIDRFFLSPVDIEEVLYQVGALTGVAVLPPGAKKAGADPAVAAATWDAHQVSTLRRVDTLDDAAIALLQNELPPELRTKAEREAQGLSELAAIYGFPRAARISRELAEMFSADTLTPRDAVSMSERLLGLRQELEGVPQPPAEKEDSFDAPQSEGGNAIQRGAESVRVLAVDDDAATLDNLKSLLSKRGLNVTTLAKPLLFWDVLEQVKPKLIVLDVDMPKICGTELCRTLRNDSRWNDVTIVLLTDRERPADISRAFAAGADDHIAKPLIASEVVLRLDNRLERLRIRRGASEKDPLTNLSMAERATEFIERFLKLARRKSDAYAIAVVEIERFPELVKEHGEKAGDDVLAGVGNMLSKSFRGEDIVGLWPGGVFTVGMYGSSKEQGGVKLSQVCAKLAQQDFQSRYGENFRISCNGGIAQYQIDGDTVEALRNEALDVMRQAREVGLNQVGVSGMRPASPLTRRVDVSIIDDDVALLSLLRHAMESRSLSVATFSDGESAVHALAGETPEVQTAVILLDVDLPVLNGLEVLRRLNNANVTKRSSVVMLTERAGERDVLDALELGAIDHVTKPFSVPVLVHKVKALRQNQQW